MSAAAATRRNKTFQLVYKWIIRINKEIPYWVYELKKNCMIYTHVEH